MKVRFTNYCKIQRNLLPGGVNVNELMRIAAETEAQSATPRPPLPSLSTRLSSKLKR